MKRTVIKEDARAGLAILLGPGSRYTLEETQLDGRRTLRKVATLGLALKKFNKATNRR